MRYSGPRRGFTMIEMLVVFVIMAIIVTVSLPNFSSTRRGSNLLSAKAQLAAQISNAKASAVSRGATATFMRAGNKAWVVSPTGGRADTSYFSTAYNVQITSNNPSATADTITFNGLGVATPRLPATRRLYVRYGTKTDSVCVTGMGVIMRQRCL